MPNWTANTIHARGTPEDLRAFINAVKWEDKVFDFNRIIPMPEILKHTRKGFRAIEGQWVKSWYVIDHTEPFPEGKHVRRFTSDEEVLLESIGHRNWYDWSVATWGTERNARNPEIDKAGSAYGHVEISFLTAWSEPMPIFQKMFQLFPQISFVCVWEHEDDCERYSIERIIGNHRAPFIRTAGRVTLRVEQDSFGEYLQILDGETCVALVPLIDIHDTGNEPFSQLAHARARLFSAAPDLLGALWGMMEVFVDSDQLEDYDDLETVKAARAAIRKACGS